MRKDTYIFNPAPAYTLLWKLGYLRCASADFSEVSELQYEYRKKLFDLYSKNRDDKDKDYKKEQKTLEREMGKAVQHASKEIYDEVKEKIGHEITVENKKAENKYNFWMYKGNTGMKILVTLDGKKIMTLKCGRDINHETSGKMEIVKVILGNEDVLNKKKDKDKFLEFKAADAKDIIRIYGDCLKKVL
mgnify:CR=1 FL=1